MAVPLLDLTRQYEPLAAAILGGISETFSSQRFILGKAVEDFEGEFAAAFGIPYAVGMSSGTDAQLAILIALGIGPGDAVLTSPYTFFATAGSITRTGAEAVFADVREDTLHLDPECARRVLEEGVARSSDSRPVTPSGNRIRALIPVHLFGSVCRMDLFEELALEFGLDLIEDAAQAVGAQFPSSGEPAYAGALAGAGFFSFFPTKNLGGAGDGGMAVCRDGDFAARLRCVRNHGMSSTYRHEIVGGNFRLDALQAVTLSAKLPHLPGWNAKRLTNAARYRELLSPLYPKVRLPCEPHISSGLPGHHTYHQYVIRAERRDALREHLTARSIGHAVYYPIPLHLQPCFAPLGYRKGDFPVAEAASETSLALPIFPELRDAELVEVATAISEFYSL